MALSYKQKRKYSVLLLLVALPLYILVVWGVVGLLPRMHVGIELALYAFLGVAWAIPFKSVFLGVGQADPDAAPDPYQDDR